MCLMVERPSVGGSDYAAQSEQGTEGIGWEQKSFPSLFLRLQPSG